VVGLQAWLCYQLVLHYRRGSRLASLKPAREPPTDAPRAVAAPTPTSAPAAQPLPPPTPPLSPEWAGYGLPPGTMATDFELPDLSGGRMTLSQWQGQQILLVFVDPRCPFSRELLAVLGTLSEDATDGRPMPLLVSSGSIEENRRLVAEYGLRGPVLLQEER